MEPTPGFPITSITSALKNHFVKKINEQEISLKDFTVSTDHPNNIIDQEHPCLNLYPFQVNVVPDFKNTIHSDGPDSSMPVKIQFLVSATGDHIKLFPHVLIDCAIKAVFERPILEIDEYNSMLRISLVPMNTEELATIWTALKCSHKVSIVLSVDIANKGSKESS